MTAAELIALAERVERLQGPCRETDAKIAEAIGLCIGRCGGHPQDGRLPHFTSSLDAAMSLVPERWRNWSSDSSVKGWTRWMLAGPRNRWIVSETGEREAGNDWYQQGIARTPALALTAAALRARAAMEKNDDA